MRATAAVLMGGLVGCGTILNGKTATVTAPPGVFVDGQPTPVIVSQQRSHDVQYPDGRRCVLDSRVSGGYVVADILLTFLLGVIVDAVTDNWRVLDSGSCPGVFVD